MKKNFKIIAFDADDTLWENENFYQEKESEFCLLLNHYLPPKEISRELFKTEMQNLELYGYGAKGFLLSMIETALRISSQKIEQDIINKIIMLGKDLLNQPVVLIDGVVEVLEYLYKKGCKLVVATKGDLLDQERKLKNSNILHYFHHVEIMSNKRNSNYQNLIKHLDIEPENFLMIGNSFKSDIEPVINLKGYGIHVPFHVTWEHEKSSNIEKHSNWIKIQRISEIMEIL